MLLLRVIPCHSVILEWVSVTHRSRVVQGVSVTHRVPSFPSSLPPLILREYIVHRTLMAWS
jgi:hypothetical protein